MIKDPQLFVSKECKELFDNMSKRSEFRNLENKDLFMLAVLFGYHKGEVAKKTVPKAERAKSGLTRERYLNDKDIAIFKAICLKELQNVEMATRAKIIDVFLLAEEYANGGYQDLKRFVFEEPGTFSKRFAAMLLEVKTEKISET